MERQKVTNRFAEDCWTPFSLLLVRTNRIGHALTLLPMENICSFMRDSSVKLRSGLYPMPIEPINRPAKGWWFLLVRLNAILSGECDPSSTPFSSLEWVANEALINTVSGITVLGYVGRSGVKPDASPSEVSQPWKVKIPQREKYQRT